MSMPLYTLTGQDTVLSIDGDPDVLYVISDSVKGLTENQFVSVAPENLHNSDYRNTVRKQLMKAIAQLDAIDDYGDTIDDTFEATTPDIGDYRLLRSAFMEPNRLAGLSEYSERLVTHFMSARRFR